MSTTDIDNITYCMNDVYIDDNYSSDTLNTEQDLISYIQSQPIDSHIKNLVISLVDNDDYNSYLDIYNICQDNNIELPPLL
jgi:hypothetical protein